MCYAKAFALTSERAKVGDEEGTIMDGFLAAEHRLRQIPEYVECDPTPLFQKENTGQLERAASCLQGWRDERGTLVVINKKSWLNWVNLI